MRVEMDVEKIKRTHHEKQMWTRFGTVILGLWLLVAPETFGYLHEPLSMSDWISGALLVFVFGLEKAQPTGNIYFDGVFAALFRLLPKGLCLFSGGYSEYCFVGF